MILAGGIIQHDLAHQIVHGLGDTIGYWWVLALMIIGAAFFFKKKIKELFK